MAKRRRPVPKAYNEVGVGLPHFLSAELEHADGTEERVKGWVRMDRIQSFYMRVWVGRTVWILDTDKPHLSARRKPYTAFKIVLGMGGWVDD